MKTEACYERVSSDKQDFAAQHGDLEAYAQSKPGVLWFSDKATGKNLDRKGFNRMMEGVRSGKIGKVIVWRLDRLGRTASGLTALFEEFIRLGVDFVSIKDGIDLRTPAGRLIANVLASVAAYETEIRSERIMAGIKAKRERGEAWGNGRPKGTPDKLTPAVVDTVKRMKIEGCKVVQIARDLRISRQSVYVALGHQSA
jgi:DNA invertase Pin-like site-specific DNA recombinase